MLIGLSSCIKDDEDFGYDGENKGTAGEHTWVDLGLPSGTLWSDCNIGASNVYEFGNYYAWGETSVKKEYTQDNCKWHYSMIPDMLEEGVISGYTLTDKYDAAASNWKNGWRMPTKEEFLELIDNCDWSWETIGDNIGYKVSSKTNDAWIFLPVAGLRERDETFYLNRKGAYWSASLYGEDDSTAFQVASTLDIYETLIEVDAELRLLGLPIRPVRSSK